MAHNHLIASNAVMQDQTRTQHSIQPRIQAPYVPSGAGVEVLPEYLSAGLKFSWPTYKSGLRVMISAHLQTGSTWAFSEIFAWQVSFRQL